MAVPRPCTIENIVSGIDITVCHIATERTDMGPYRQTLLYDLPTLVAFLRGETWVHSDDLMSSTLSLHFKNVEERAPRGVHDALCQGMILDHVENLKLLNSDHLIVFSVLLCRLIVKIPTLTGDLEMRLRRATSSFTASMRTLLASTYRTLLASQGFLRGTIEARVLDGMALTIRQERFESDINPDVMMRAVRGSMFSTWLCLTDDESIPVSIGPMDQVNRLRRTLYRAMQLDLEEMSQFLGNNEMFLVLMQIRIFSILPQLNAMPAIGLLKTWEAHTRDVICFRGKETLKRFREPVCEHLHRCGGHMFTSMTFESIFQIVLTGKRALLLILLFDHLKHTIIDLSRLSQASHEQVGLFLLHVQSVLKCFHVLYCNALENVCQQVRPPAGGRQFTHMLESSGPLAAFLVVFACLFKRAEKGVDYGRVTSVG